MMQRIVRGEVPVVALTVLLAFAPVVLSLSLFVQEPGATTGTNRFDPKSIKQWVHKGPLGELPRRVTEDLPLSDQQNRGGWRMVEAMSDEFSGGRLDTNKWVLGIEGWRGRQPAWFNPTNVSNSE